MTRTETTTTAPTRDHSFVAISRREAMTLAETAYARLVDVIETIEGEEWQRPTDCTGWSVRDMAGHVLGAMRSAASERELISQQLASARLARRDGVALVDAMTRLQIERTADLSTDQLVTECRALVTKAMRGRRRTPAPIRSLVKVRVRMNSIDERWSVGYLTDTILTRDAWLHRVDLSRALGRPLVLTADHDGRIVGDVATEWMRRHGRPCRLVLIGPAGGTFVNGGDDAPSIELDAVEFCRIVSRRSPGEGLLATEVPF